MTKQEKNERYIPVKNSLPGPDSILLSIITLSLKIMELMFLCFSDQRRKKIKNMQISLLCREEKNTQ